MQDSNLIATQTVRGFPLTSFQVLESAVFVMQAWKEQATNIVISKLHNDVSSCLHSMQIAHQNEYLTDDQLFSIDVAMQGRVPPIALEVDGPFHFTANTHLPLGKPQPSHLPPTMPSATSRYYSPRWRIVRPAKPGVLTEIQEYTAF